MRIYTNYFLRSIFFQSSSIINLTPLLKGKIVFYDIIDVFRHNLNAS